MKTKTNRIIKVTLIVSVVLLLIGFGLYKLVNIGFKQPCPPPVKPNGIPTEAIWNGGCDGGYWLELAGIKGTKYRFRIYLDYKAEVLMDADFIAESGCPLPKDNSILTMVKVVDIDKIIVQTNDSSICIMTPIYPAYGGSSWEVIKEKREY